MRKKRMLAFLIAACLAFTPAMTANAGNAKYDRGGAENSEPDILTASVTDGDGKTAANSGIAADMVSPGMYAAGTGNSITEDFESVTDNWGMTGDLAGNVSVDATDKYLKLEGNKIANQDAPLKTAVKKFEEVTAAMSTATVEYTWHTSTMTSTSFRGRAGIQLSCDGVEVLTLYMGEHREGKDDDNNRGNTPVYYSVAGGEIQATATRTKPNTTHTVNIELDFEAHAAKVIFDGSVLLENVELSEAVDRVDSLDYVVKVLPNAGNPTENVNNCDIKMGMDDFKLSWTKAGEKSIFEDFESVADNWGMTGDLAGNISVDATDKYLKLEGNKIANQDAPLKTAVKKFEEVTAAMSTATVEYTWHTSTMTSTSFRGRAGIQLSCDGVEVLTLYMGEHREGKDDDNNRGNTPVYYSVAGGEIQATATRTKPNTTQMVKIELDFEAHTANVIFNGTVLLENVELSEAVDRIDGLDYVVKVLPNAGNPTENVNNCDIKMGMDDFSMTYVESGSTTVKSQLWELAALENVTATKDQFNPVYPHPTTVMATVKTGEEKKQVEIQIDASTWKAENTDTTLKDKSFNSDEMGEYLWTADVIAPDGVMNPLNLQVSYVMDYRSDFLDTDINSIKNPDTVLVKKEEWVNGTYSHPTQVAATLVNGKVIIVPIDKDSWTCTPAFDVNVKGSYVWTADLAASAENRNHRNLKVSYTMNYAGNWTSSHDYEDDFLFGVQNWDVWGKDIDGTSGTGGFKLEIKDNNGDPYLSASNSDNKDKNRGSRLNLPTDIVKGATMEFDFLPVSIGGEKPLNLLFVAPGVKQNYFTLCVDSNGKISYHTTEDLAGNPLQEVNNSFTGVISSDSPVATNVGETGKWAHVKLEFDYVTHTAALTVSAKDGSGTPYTITDIPIDERANGLSIMVIRKVNGCDKPEAGFDNIIVDYDKFGAGDIVDVIQPADINMTRAAIDSYQYPATVTVKLGDGSKDEVAVGEWTADPAFDKETENVYTWTAPLVTDKYTNLFKLQATYKMNYTILPYVVTVSNPPTLELQPGDSWSMDVLPETVTAFLSNGEQIEARVEDWTAIRPFEADVEGIYVYGAKLAQGEDYAVVPDRFLPNEYHGDARGVSQITLEEHFSASPDLAASLRQLWNYIPDQFDYDVFYRISCDASANGYNSKARSMERLDRGVTAVPSGSGILVSWRVLQEEYGTGVQFNVLRNGKVINDTPITSKSNYLDPTGKPGNLYSIQVIKGGTSTYSPVVEALAQNYMSIPLQQPEPQMDKEGNFQTYSINDAGVADVDGDGQYEVVVKWYPSDAFDSGKQDGPSGPTIFDCYEMDGTPLWRMNMGLEMPSGAHFNQFMLYDLDEDGKAEFFIKTSDGTVTYKPNANGKFDMTDQSTEVSYIGDRSVVPGTNINSTGHANVNSNEYISIFNGATGEVIDTISYVNEVKDFNDYNDNWGNRASRFNIALAYQPKAGGSGEAVPTVLFNRGYYAKTTVAAYQLINGHLELAWNFDVPNGDRYAGKGNHNVSTGDMDNDGYDELVIGALAIDHDGSVLWAKDGIDGQDYQGHSDSIHLSAMNPENPTQLYVFTPSEEKESTLNGTLSNAANGSRINGLWHELADIGRGVAANITPMPGFEYWINTPNNEGDPTGGIYNFFGDVVASTPPSKFSTNWRLYWDGDLLSELGDGNNPGAGGTEQTVYKYDWENNELDTLAVFSGTHTNNGTKNNPSLTADLFGDWREEVMVGNSDNTELRIYMTPYETEYMIYSLMQDPVYRNAVANQNTSYNQPPHLGFYLGEDNRDQVLAMQLPKADIWYTTTLDGKPAADKADPAGVYEPEPEAVLDEKIVNDSLKEAVNNAAVKDKTGCSTPDELRSHLQQKVIEMAKEKGFGTISGDSTMLVEVRVWLLLNGSSNKVLATKSNFPAAGVDVTIPYPEGTTKDGYEFVITHLITMGCNGTTEGSLETFSSINNDSTDGTITKTDEGLRIHITSASPFYIGWQEKSKITDPKPGNPDSDESDDSQVEETEENGTKQSNVPKTGDHMDVAAAIWTIVLLAAFGGAVAVFVIRRRKDTVE